MFSNLKKCVSIRLLRAERLSFVFCFHRQRQHHHRQHRKPKVFRSLSSSKFTYGRKQKRYCKYLSTIEQSKISYPLFYFVFISFFFKNQRTSLDQMTSKPSSLESGKEISSGVNLVAHSVSFVPQIR